MLQGKRILHTQLHKSLQISLNMQLAAQSRSECLADKFICLKFICHGKVTDWFSSLLKLQGSLDYPELAQGSTFCDCVPKHRWIAFEIQHTPCNVMNGIGSRIILTVHKLSDWVVWGATKAEIPRPHSFQLHPPQSFLRKKEKKNTEGF